jgi:hypothetical protein
VVAELVEGLARARGADGVDQDRVVAKSRRELNGVEFDAAIDGILFHPEERAPVEDLTNLVWCCRIVTPMMKLLVERRPLRPLTIVICVPWLRRQLDRPF